MTVGISSTVEPLTDSNQMAYADNSRDDERFSSSNPFDWTTPKSDFESSNFRTEYKAFSKDKVSAKTVRDCLPYDIQQKYDGFSSHLKVEEKCVKIWTLSSVVYPTLTQALYTDNKHQIKKICSIDSWYK